MDKKSDIQKKLVTGPHRQVIKLVEEKLPNGRVIIHQVFKQIKKIKKNEENKTT